MESYRVEDLTFIYPTRTSPALDSVSLTVERGAFVTLAGKSGCGKTTLLRQLKPALAPHGTKSGAIYFEGARLDTLSKRDQSARIGFVMQSPDNQLVTDKVWHELAFGLESLGMDTPSIRLRVAEMASFFGIQTWFYKNVAELSGGQKQLLNLASIMAMQPSVLILDEPASQLDPIAASELLATVGKINRELGVTVILTEHRLEEVFPLSTRVIIMDDGRITADGTPQEVGMALRDKSHGMFLAMPTPMRIWAGVKNSLPCPVTVRDGRAWLEKLGPGHEAPARERRPYAPPEHGDCAVELDEVWFKYEKNLPDVVKALSFKAHSGEIFAVLGGNGTGKTTSLSLIARLNRPYRGKIRINGEDLDSIPERRLFNGLLGVLPQNPQALFVKKTVAEDLLEILSDTKLPKAKKEEQLHEMARLCRIDGLLSAHPYDLSGGEQQRAALAKVLLLRPHILLLDEPTKGLDAEFKQVFAGILQKLAAAGATVIMVSHDVEFCAEYAHRCALFFDGSIVSCGAPGDFFAGNSFYTSAANRMSRQLLPGAVTVNDVITALGGEPFDIPITDDGTRYEIPALSGHKETSAHKETPDGTLAGSKRRRAPLWRFVDWACGILIMIAAVFAVRNLDGLRDFLAGSIAGGNEITGDGSMVWLYALIMLLFTLGLVGIAVAMKPDKPEYIAKENRVISKRTLTAAFMILLLIPLTIYIGCYYLGDRKYYFISMLIIFESMLPFALIFESRKPQARELIIIAVLCGIAVAGRAAFFMLPQYKPVAALVIIAGVAFGGEAGFLVGAMTGFVSNMFFGQGPWTPWQMFAFGVIGFLAGVLFRKGLLSRGRIALAIFGGIAVFFIYGGIMNPASVFMFQPAPKLEMFMLAYLRGIPFDLVHAGATVFFMLIISQPMLEKLDRIKVKYGLVE